MKDRKKKGTQPPQLPPSTETQSTNETVNNPPAQNENREGFNLRSMLVNVIIFFLLFNFVIPMIRNAVSPPPPQPIPAPMATGSESLYPLISANHRLAFRIYLSDSPDFFQQRHPNKQKSVLVWTQKGIGLGDYYTRETQIPIPIKEYLGNLSTEEIMKRKELYLHAMFFPQEDTKTVEDFLLNQRQSAPRLFFYESCSLIEYRLQEKFVEKQNLITGEKDAPELSKQTASSKHTPIEIPHFKPNLTLSLVEDYTAYPNKKNLPPPLPDVMRFAEDDRGYFPVVFFNNFWLFREHHIPLNETVDEVVLTLEYVPIGLTKFLFYNQMEQSFSIHKGLGSTSDSEIDELKRVFLETNPYLLGLTFAVSLLHTIFDFLAFKNDISHWRNKKSMEGMSIRSLFLNTGCQIIIFLYLLDNETSWLILFNVGIGLLIEFWKITKATDVSLSSWHGIPYPVFKDKVSYVSETKEYDQKAFKWLGIILFPLLVGYSIYSLIYQTHRGWYSWILASLTGAVYTFGFIMMTPQLFINYKLKSVAHLPFRALIYKALNTFIDDLFAFIIKMPTLHRLACFRDDLVFLIYMYQRWIYRVDARRYNEFGSREESDDSVADPALSPQEEKEKSE